ncbi:hypothetical protein MKW92_032471, partial [Papaver armeniacum]
GGKQPRQEEIFKLQASSRARKGIGAYSTAGTKGDLCRSSTGSAATSTITVVSRGARGKVTLTISDGVGSCTTR